MKPIIAILGAGSMASALAVTLAPKASSIRLYTIEPDVEEEINVHHRNPRYLSHATFAPHILATASLQTCLMDATFVFLAVPSSAVSSVLAQSLPFINRQAIVINLAKGFATDKKGTIAEYIQAALPKQLAARLVTIGGPAIAKELAHGLPTGFACASNSRVSLESVKKILTTKAIKIETTPDVCGVSLCAALKNAYAIALGMCEALGYGTNAKALLLTLACQEMAEIVEACGGKRTTAYGLAGLGDLVTTGFSPHSRNRTFGAGEQLQSTTVEGIGNATTGALLTKRLKTPAPLLHAIARALKNGHTKKEVLETYLERHT